MEPSPHFLVLAATILEALGPGAVDSDTLSRLHAVFGPTLSSALQLVDRREVVRVDIAGRRMFQVSSASGTPYTLYLDLELPPLNLPPPSPAPSLAKSKRDTEWENGEEHMGAEEQGDGESEDEDEERKAEKERERKIEEKAREKRVRAHRIRALAERLAYMYCPCTGYAFNALDGKQILCKHILAVLVAHRLGRVVETTVGLHAAAGLLGIVA